MFNTTTIPTSINIPFSFCHIASILSLGGFMWISVIEMFLSRLRRRESSGEDFSDSEWDSEFENDNYCDTYTEAFEALPVRDLSEDELASLNTKIVREEVADEVEVILTYDKTTETFWYYTDKLKEISYDILETVAQKFAIEHDCKAIFLQVLPEPSALGAASLGAAALEPASLGASLEPACEVVTQHKVEKPSVFAKFKDYNTGGKGSVPNFTSVIKVIEQMNHFRYRGKICDYEATLKAEKKSEEKTIDYASYKKLLETHKIKTL
jgi:hypothetical protein